MGTLNGSCKVASGAQHRPPSHWEHMPSIPLCFWTTGHLDSYRGLHPQTTPAMQACSSPSQGVPAGSPSCPKNCKEGGVVPGDVLQGVQCSQLVEVELPVRGRAHQPSLQECGPLLLQGPRTPHISLADGKGTLVVSPAQPSQQGSQCLPPWTSVPCRCGPHGPPPAPCSSHTPKPAH